MRINNQVIKLIDYEHIFYKLIYSLEFIKLKMFKTYIKPNLANIFKISFKLHKKRVIFLVKKFNKSF